jgi:hypothetical protein
MLICTSKKTTNTPEFLRKVGPEGISELAEIKVKFYSFKIRNSKSTSSTLYFFDTATLTQTLAKSLAAK